MSERSGFTAAKDAHSGWHEELLETLVVRYRDPLIRYFERRAPRLKSEAEDLAQEVFVRLVRRDFGRDITHLEGYIFQTAASVLVDRSRRGATRLDAHHVSFDPTQHGGEDFSPERVYLGQWRVQEVVRILKSLPHKTRQVFVLHRFEDMKYGEIASHLGISVSAVEKHVMKALRRLSEMASGHD